MGKKFDGRLFFMLHSQMSCPMNGVAVASPRAELQWRERSWRRMRRRGPPSFSFWSPCHNPHPLALAGLGLKSQWLHRSGATEHRLWATPGCLGPHTFVPDRLNFGFGEIGVDVCGVIHIAP